MKTKTVLGEDLDDRDDYEERIERSDFDMGVDDHAITPIPHVNDMEIGRASCRERVLVAV